MPRKSPYDITLTDEDRSRLETLATSYTSPYCDVVRAKVVLLAEKGWQNKKIAEYLHVPRQIVSKWRKRFFEERFAGLQDRPSPSSTVTPPKNFFLIYFCARSRANRRLCAV